LESGDEAFFDSDEEVPQAFISAFPASDDEAEEKMELSANGKKRKDKRKLKHLPTFASYDDYAKLVDEDEDEVW